MLEDIKSIMISEEEISKRVKELGKQLTEDYKGKELLVVGILKGCMLFLSDLVRTIELPLTMDFMVVSSYGATTKSSGVVRIIKDLEREIEGKDVLIVEDIVDTGLTLSYLVENFKARNPKSVRVCSLLDKPDRRKAQVDIQYVGFKIPDEFVVGYGLDYGENYRNLPFVCVLKPEVYTKK
ncbi:MAG TPA: hypoxanthine phosphoribosyltransferase [Bacillota bacterium]|nr:hypoxanthine phosphoribosyltransferase [Bacillota bacterium]HQE66493.1 hypoxanthine phosphoribosyltransferase [Bacillota bacterium]HQJ37594.1 hypoxanthine phosphoribosyltransferase [Bacillota bacterium]HQL36918.1 hypoxanthine phosphoribosyltransferase [Bacillota bacterium]